MRTMTGTMKKVAEAGYDQVEFAVRAVHHFGDEPEHHRAATLFDHHVIQ